MAGDGVDDGDDSDGNESKERPRLVGRLDMAGKG